jgi:hypothetical protein
MRCGVDAGRWTGDSGQWAVGHGPWAVSNRRWIADGGQQTADSRQQMRFDSTCSLERKESKLGGSPMQSAAVSPRHPWAVDIWQIISKP